MILSINYCAEQTLLAHPSASPNWPTFISCSRVGIKFDLTHHWNDRHTPRYFTSFGYHFGSAKSKYPYFNKNRSCQLPSMQDRWGNNIFLKEFLCFLLPSLWSNKCYLFFFPTFEPLKWLSGFLKANNSNIFIAVPEKTRKNTFCLPETLCRISPSVWWQ